MPAPRPTHLEIDGRAVEIRRSARRRRTVQARIEGETIVVLAPASMTAREERAAVEDLVRRLTRKARSSRNDDDLMRRAKALSRRHVPGAPVPSSVRWVSNMTTRWASCSTGDGSIRLSEALIGMPSYVVDSVILHEVTHLVVSGHGPDFHRIVRADPNHDRAEAFLAGASFAARRSAGQVPLSTLDDDVDPSGDAHGASDGSNGGAEA